MALKLVDHCYGMMGGDLWVCETCHDRSVMRPGRRPDIDCSCPAANPSSTPPPLPSVEALRAIVARDKDVGDLTIGWVTQNQIDRRTLLALVGALWEALQRLDRAYHGQVSWDSARELLALCDAAGIEGRRHG